MAHVRGGPLLPRRGVLPGSSKGGGARRRSERRAASTPSGSGAGKADGAGEREGSGSWREDWLFGGDWSGRGKSREQKDQGSAPRKMPGRRGVRDEWEPRNRDVFLNISEMSLFEKLNPNVEEEEALLRAESRRNSQESKDAVAFLATLFVIPLGVSTMTSKFVFHPLVTQFSEVHATAFEVHGHQKREGAKELHQEEARLRMLANVGEAPALTEMETAIRLHEKAEEIAEEFIEGNRRALTNGLSDTAGWFTLVSMIVVQRDRWDTLLETMKRLFDGFSDTGKAFLIILVTDIILGYHSEAGWAAVLTLICQHYGVEVEEEWLYGFIAIVPVAIDSYFKFWVFRYLTGLSPTARVTFQAMNRH